jgi:membrane-associated HD superfamily phosphohydrolase
MDSKLLRTLLPFWFRPGKLTNEYLAGKRVRYISPFRLFIFWMTLFLVIFNWSMDSYRINDSWNYYSQAKADFQIDSIKDVLVDRFPDSISQDKIKSVFLERKSTSSEQQLDSNTMYFQEFILMRPEQVFEQFGLDSSSTKHYYEKKLIKQILKILKNSGQFVVYIVGHISWAILFCIPFMGLLLKLLYWRQKRNYVEHFIFLLHMLALLFSVLTVYFYQLSGIDDFVNFGRREYLCFLLLFIYMLWSLKVVYRQGYIKTIFKMVLFMIGNLVIVLLTTAIFIMLNLLLF